MQTWLLRVAAAALILLALGAIMIWLTLRASLPQLDGEIVVQGLDRSATIARDEYGIPTITADSRLDLAFATGFAHGQDRFFQMDLIRRRAAGELSELFGEIALEFDKRHRFHRFRHRAREVLAQTSAGDLIVSNWKSERVVRLSGEGELLGPFDTRELCRRCQCGSRKPRGTAVRAFTARHGARALARRGFDTRGLCDVYRTQ